MEKAANLDKNPKDEDPIVGEEAIEVQIKKKSCTEKSSDAPVNLPKTLPTKTSGDKECCTEKSSDTSASSSVDRSATFDSPGKKVDADWPSDESSCGIKGAKTNKKCCNFTCKRLIVLFLILLLVALAAGSVPFLVMPYLLAATSHTEAPSMGPSMGPSSSPTTSFPSAVPTTRSSTRPTGVPTSAPSKTSSSLPSSTPSAGPTDAPSHKPSSLPSMVGSSNPTIAQTIYQSQSPTSSPTFENATTIFYAIGDVPYNNQEKVELAERMQNLPEDGDFLIHVGDIRSASDPTIRCGLRDYLEVSQILLRSRIPVFIIPGDNEWNDCPNPLQGQSYWVETFSSFYRNWKHPFQVEHHPLWPENFHFIHKGSMYFGMNLVAGAVSNTTLYSTQLSMQFDWVKSKIDQHLEEVTRIVIFGHAFPIAKHDAFFNPLKEYIEGTLLNKVPIMYLNGDNHFYDFEPNYRGLSSFQRLQVDFGTVNPPLKVLVSPLIDGLHTNETFSHDRMLGQ